MCLKCTAFCTASETGCDGAVAQGLTWSQSNPIFFDNNTPKPTMIDQTGAVPNARYPPPLDLDRAPAGQELLSVTNQLASVGNQLLSGQLQPR